MRPRWPSPILPVVTPFDHEGARNRKADAIIDHLQREADLVMAFSNEDWANRYSDDTPLINVFAGLDRHIAYSIQGVVRRVFLHSVTVQPAAFLLNGPGYAVPSEAGWLRSAASTAAA